MSHFQSGAAGWDSRKKDPAYWSYRKRRLLGLPSKGHGVKLEASLRDSGLSMEDLNSLGTDACAISYKSWVIFCKSFYPWMDEAFK